ncbi:C-terminal region of aryl-sulfatase [Algoriphagus locisalis]|uniref:C-terminal region of aryl-sulfatase n=1 Tax=Algoriphagus locisalis TaxID=305507 RepID=A0A1I7DQV7_9BACT|nr:sulfatase [Algoriphagus locisalis]SFU14080.1 C-terminal region of aryl-sulfatase [Algoriphagus locisalis]
MHRPIIYLQLIALFFSITPLAFSQNSNESKPNFIIIFTDDQGYGDLGAFGHPTIKTPNIDQMAVEGQKWTSFYVAANVCTPSRSAILTGRLPVRTGMYSNTRRVLFPDSGGGLPAYENTIATLLKGAGYTTAAIGKWHLGHLPEFLPTSHGFDSYYGIPYSNDMDRVNDITAKEAFADSKIEYFNVPLMRNTEIIERPADQNTITKRYAEEAVSFINSNKDKPFFLYLAHSLPHVPLFASSDFKGKSERGLYGDVIEEIDWSVGEILSALKENGLDQNTYVVFTSDNGPWLVYNEQGGSAGPLFGGKGTSYEGGVRVPTVIWGPGNVKPGVISKMGSTLDLLPTFTSLAGVKMPQDRVYDGFDLSPVLKGQNATPREEMFYYHGDRLFAVRKGDFKLYFYSNNPAGYPAKVEKLEKLTLFNLGHDPSERFDLADQYPEVVFEISEIAKQHSSGMVFGETQLEKRIGY